jgi:Mrp family chromosome partitioning ATPase
MPKYPTLYLILRKGRLNMSKTEVKKSTKAVADNIKVLENLQKIRYKIVVMSGKGGVGKSTVATNLAFSLAMNGSEVGLLDVDIHGPNIPKMLGIEDERVTGDGKGILPILVPPHLKVMSMAFLLSTKDTPVIWRGPVKMGAINQFLGEVHWGDLDYLIIDLPPGTGDEPLSIAQLIPNSSGAIIVTTPQDVALLDSRKAVTFARTLNMPVIGIIENMSGFACPHCGKNIDLFGSGGGHRAALDLSVPFLGKVPIDPKIVETGDSGKPFVLEYSKSKSAESFNGIVEKVEKFVSQGAKSNRGEQIAQEARLGTGT